MHVKAHPPEEGRSAEARGADRQVAPHWPDGFDGRRCIRSRGAFHIWAVRGGEHARTVVVPAPHTDRDVALQCLRELARVHRLVSGPLFPQVVEMSEAPPLVAFELDAVGDGEQLLAGLSRRGELLGYREAAGFVRALGDALIHLHATRDPESGHPLTMGQVCWGNFLFDAQGRPSYLGLGHNLVACTEYGAASGQPGVFMAAEVAAGQGASPGGDLAACVAMFRSLLPHVALPVGLAHALSGRGEGALGRLVRWANRAVLIAIPGLRPDITTAMRAFERAWRLLGIRPDMAALRRRCLEVLTRDEAQLVVASDGSWFQLDGGDRQQLEHQAALRRILAALLDTHRTGASLSVDALREAGWPGESMVPRAANNRVHVALSTLRRRGLRGHLQRFDGGYRLDPALDIQAR